MAEPVRLRIDRLATPIGEFVIVADEDGRLRVAEWSDHDAELRLCLRRQFGEKGYVLTPAADPSGLTAAMRAYFAGSLSAIDDLPVAAFGTEFQRAVWGELRRIPCGTTISYGELARRICRPAAVRAVGLANGSNPIGVVVPCHRVIGADGSLTGYGGGLARKRWLLAHEGANAAPELALTA